MSTSSSFFYCSSLCCEAQNKFCASGEKTCWIQERTMFRNILNFANFLSPFGMIKKYKKNAASSGTKKNSFKGKRKKIADKIKRGPGKKRSELKHMIYSTAHALSDVATSHFSRAQIIWLLIFFLVCLFRQYIHREQTICWNLSKIVFIFALTSTDGNNKYVYLSLFLDPHTPMCCAVRLCVAKCDTETEEWISEFGIHKKGKQQWCT